MKENRTKITEIKEYYTVKRKEKNKAGEMVEVDKTFWRYKEINYVKGWPRFGHFLLDRVFYYIIAILVGITLGGILGFFGYANLFYNFNDRFLDLIFYCTVYPGYYLLLESTSQASLGKLILGRVVVDEYGEKPAFKQILGRSFARIVPFEPFSCFGTRGWHDEWSKTFVIRKKDLEELKVLVRLQEYLTEDQKVSSDINSF